MEKNELTLEELDRITGGTDKETRDLMWFLMKKTGKLYYGKLKSGTYDIDYDGMKEYLEAHGYRVTFHKGGSEPHEFRDPEGMMLDAGAICDRIEHGTL